MSVISILFGMLILACVGCDQTPPPPPPPSKIEKTEPPPPTEGSEEEVVEEEQVPEYTYDPTDRREPFKSLIVEDVPSVEDLIITPTPSANLTPLQKFEIDELKLTGIILGGLGDYARITAPDGKSYTINVGTLMGKREGKVISISDNVVLVKEIIRYEGGEIDEIETPLYLNPIEEGETP